MGFIALEGMGFAIAIGAYLYLMAVNPQWPLDPPPPDLWPGRAMTVLFVLSVVPNQLRRTGWRIGSICAGARRPRRHVGDRHWRCW